MWNKTIFRACLYVCKMIQVKQSDHRQTARDIQVEYLHVRLTYQPQARGKIAMTACRTVCAQLNPFGCTIYVPNQMGR